MTSRPLKVWDGTQWVHVTGSRGLQGPQGEPGPQGIQGPQGPAGVDGQDGVDGSDANVVLASQAEAEEGTNNTKLMTPLLTKQAIDQNSPPYAGWEFVATLYDAATDPNVTSVQTPSFEQGYDYMLVGDGLETTSTFTGAETYFRFRRSNGSNSQAFSVRGMVRDAPGNFYEILVYDPAGNATYHRGTVVDYPINGTSLVDNADDLDAGRWHDYHNGPYHYDFMDFYITNHAIHGGTLKLYRRPARPQ